MTNGTRWKGTDLGVSGKEPSHRLGHLYLKLSACVPALLLVVQLCANVHSGSQWMTISGSLPPAWETWMKFQALGFSLAQFECCIWGMNQWIQNFYVPLTWFFDFQIKILKNFKKFANYPNCYARNAKQIMHSNTSDLLSCSHPKFKDIWNAWKIYSV